MTIEFREKDLDKRDRIINAALDEFSRNSFDKASTNNIVKNAKVSKGLLYHYFSSKQELYDYLMDFVFRTIGDEIRNKLDWDENDFFKRIADVTLIKMNIMRKYPNLYDFGIKLLKEMSYETLFEKSKAYNLDLFQKIYHENIDFSLFKEGLDVKRAMTIIQWTIDKYGESIQSYEDLSMDHLLEEINAYMQMLKDAFYK